MQAVRALYSLVLWFLLLLFRSIFESVSFLLTYGLRSYFISFGFFTFFSISVFCFFPDTFWCRLQFRWYHFVAVDSSSFFSFSLYISLSRSLFLSFFSQLKIHCATKSMLSWFQTKGYMQKSKRETHKALFFSTDENTLLQVDTQKQILVTLQHTETIPFLNEIVYRSWFPSNFFFYFQFFTWQLNGIKFWIKANIINRTLNIRLWSIAFDLYGVHICFFVCPEKIRFILFPVGNSNTFFLILHEKKHEYFFFSCFGIIPKKYSFRYAY